MNPARFQTLITATELQQAQAAGQALLLIDTSFDLADTSAGERSHAQGHLPGAHYLHLDRDLSATKTGPDGRFRGRHPLPDRAEFAARMAALGLRPGLQVVAYDGQGGMYAARLWWMLRWIGHAEVAVLDGGHAAWVADGGALSTAPALTEANTRTAPLPLPDSLVPHLDADALQCQLGRLRLIDARAPERFRGEVEPLDAKAGHIPGARNRLFKTNLQDDGRFKPAEQLRQEFHSLLAPFAPAEVVHQCGSGVTACHNLLAMEHAGLSGSRLYPGSWSEWSSDPSRPVAQG
ncbi:sulfurtransferase [Paucibacter aquatile]|uniref:Sulfurtransferase n=1 Tax=Kinneretia aquatilis TaxID=2070761 RepID=A0A2N8L3T1_9BURK|nr:sulfurtransferase [Paucibacter aquatile]PND40361.1 sulfurtransferase [Paucibacter aquatile]